MPFIGAAEGKESINPHAMKHFYQTFLLTVLMSMVGARVSAHDIEEANADAPVYNLNGQRVNAPVNGIYIKNGRKVLVK